MSSILKALKKVEETTDQADNDHPWPHSGESREAITRNIRKRWFRRRLTTYVLVAACLISLAVVLFLRQSERVSRQQTDRSSNTMAANTGQVHRAKIERTAPPGMRSDSSADRQQRTTSRTKTTVRPAPPASKAPPAIRKSTPQTAAKIDRSPPPQPQRRKPLPKRSKKAATKTRPSAESQSSRKLPAAAPASEKRPTASSRKQKATPSGAQKATQYDQLQDTGLTLQAIAWSSVPAERIAVINGSIVREGDAIEGFTLRRIRPDDIVLNDGSKTWQLNFGLRSE